MYKKHYIDYIGFSLIELMIVVSILAILTSLAIPSYQKYIRRSRFAEVITATAPFKLSVSLALQEGIAINELASGQHGIPFSPTESRNLASIQVEKGIITATASKELSNTTYILIPDSEGRIWNIRGTCLDNGMCNA